MESAIVEGARILPTPHPAVMFREVSEGAVLLQMEEEIYFGLNEVGTRVWRLLPPACSSVDEVCARLVEAYPDAAPEQIRSDVEELLGELRANKLVVEPS